MQEKPLNRINKNETRVYLVLDISDNSCIMGYKWSNTELEWVFDKMIWNVWEETLLQNNLREGKYLLGIL